MGYPQLLININHLKKNCKAITSLCSPYGINVLGVCKAVTCDPNIVKAYISSGISAIGDSRISNLKKIRNFNIEKWLIRMPMASEIKEVVKYSDVSLQSDLSTIDLIENYCSLHHQFHQVVLMFDLGDLREGFFNEDEFHKAIDYVRSLKYVHLKGIGTNLTCLSFIIPDDYNLKRLVKIAKKNNVDFISGGNSASLSFMMEGKMPHQINQLRLGESLLIGKERHHYQFLPNTYHDTFILETQIIECRLKPSMPIGTIGKNSYGIQPIFKDRGIIKRAILAVGNQDIDDKTIEPLDSHIQIIDASCDHLVVDVTHCQKDYKVGDIIAFRLGYFAIMRAFTSSYISKSYIWED